jgi:hypothetical protein
VTEDLGEEDIVGDALGFELEATDGAVGRAEVALASRFQRAESDGSVLGELRAGGARAKLSIPRRDKCATKFFAKMEDCRNV